MQLSDMHLLDDILAHLVEIGEPGVVRHGPNGAAGGRAACGT
jgi:hypothetical protein